VVVLLLAAVLVALQFLLPGDGLLRLLPFAPPASGGYDRLVEIPPDGTAVPDPGSPDLPGTGGGVSTTPTTDPTAPGDSACTAPCTTSQVVSVTILPGPFVVSSPDEPLVVRTGSDGTGSAVLEGVQVTDTRGAEGGWALTATAVSVVDASGAPVPDLTLEVVPTCTKTAGPLTLQSAAPGTVRAGEQATLCIVPTAAAGSLAGGVVEASAVIRVSGAPADAELRLTMDVAGA
jgi:hypothetical protein